MAGWVAGLFDNKVISSTISAEEDVTVKLRSAIFQEDLGMDKARI